MSLPNTQKDLTDRISLSYRQLIFHTPVLWLEYNAEVHHLKCFFFLKMHNKKVLNGKSCCNFVELQKNPKLQKKLQKRVIIFSMSTYFDTDKKCTEENKKQL